jgi:5'-phosphate synthase pdxT subunit
MEMALKAIALQGRIVIVKLPKEMGLLDGLIIPGGESTVQCGLSAQNGVISSIKERIRDGLPVMATCAGVIMLARNATDRAVCDMKLPLIGALDVHIERNFFGRQRNSFETELHIPVIGEKPFKGVFIRAPSIKSTGKGVEVLSKLDDQIVAVRERRLLGMTFHPELVKDLRLHEHFLRMIVAQSA